MDINWLIECCELDGGELLNTDYFKPSARMAIDTEILLEVSANVPRGEAMANYLDNLNL